MLRSVVCLFAASAVLRSTNAFTNHISRASKAGIGIGTQLYSAAVKSLPDGITKTVTVEGNGRRVRPGDVVVARYTCRIPESGSSFAQAERQRFIVGDGTMIRGWDLVLCTMTQGERASAKVVRPEFGYGEAGSLPFVPGNAKIEIDVEILDIEEMSGFSSMDPSDLGSMGMDGPISRPRTPGAIAAAYEQKMRNKAMETSDEKEGLEGIIDKIKGFYFFGLFEGETGQDAPWYLKPSITFPIAFLFVGAAFYVSLIGGAISERGMPSTDELDEIIISAGSFPTSLVALNVIINFGLPFLK